MSMSCIDTVTRCVTSCAFIKKHHTRFDVRVDISVEKDIALRDTTDSFVGDEFPLCVGPRVESLLRSVPAPSGSPTAIAIHATGSQSLKVTWRVSEPTDNKAEPKAVSSSLPRSDGRRVPSAEQLKEEVRDNRH